MIEPPLSPRRGAQIAHLGVIDWGIGGLDFAARFRTAHPNVRVSYLSDSGFTPYGKVAEAKLQQRLKQATEFLHALGASPIVVACNAASSVLGNVIQSSALEGVSRPMVVGVIQHTVTRLLALNPPEVLILGGERTILSQVYEAPLNAAGIRVQAIVAQPLSALVEAGKLDGPEVRNAIEQLAVGVRPAAVLVPACTHYVALLPLLCERFRPELVVDPATETLRGLDGTMAPTRSNSLNTELSRCYTTGSAAKMTRAARFAFGLDLPRVTAVPLRLDASTLAETPTEP